MNSYSSKIGAPAQDALLFPVQFLKGVGPMRAERLKELGIETVGDLLYYFPRAWEDRRETLRLDRPPESGKVTVKAEVLDVEVTPFRGRGGLALFKARVRCRAGVLDAVWFKRATPRYDVFKSLADEVKPGATVWLVGRPEQTLLAIHELRVEEQYPEGPKAELHVDRWVPVYPLTEGVSGRFLREAVHQALERAASAAPDPVPAELLRARGLLPLSTALKEFHFPDSEASREAARKRLAYEEFLLIETALAVKRRQTKQAHKPFRYDLKRHLLSPFRKRLGFEFTRSQTRVIHEIFSDMRGPYPMTRLLQGEVGSGKTVVAVSALLLAVESGYQGALMAPTEILAEQHYFTLERLLKGLPVKTALLTSKFTPKQRAAVLAGVAAQDVGIVVGTHALLEQDVAIPKLALAVVDEQHRFGVRQRAELRRKGLKPDLLVMTATPIPRTLALTLYGDLEISTLKELPPGRRPVTTRRVSEREALESARREVAAGHQAYVVYPVIEEGTRAELKAAAAEVERLRAGIFSGLRVDLLHGQMRAAKKDAIMEAFAAGKIDVLVATPVVEIGLDVPNATVMVIQHPERFGLASLHQLRGRVGRSALESYCFLVGEPKGPAEERVLALCRTHDGFEISEQDMRLRGPGEVLGTEQHGPLTLKAGDLLEDYPLIMAARQDSAALLESDPNLMRPENEALKTRLIAQFQRRWHWIDLA